MFGDRDCCHAGAELLGRLALPSCMRLGVVLNGGALSFTAATCSMFLRRMTKRRSRWKPLPADEAAALRTVDLGGAVLLLSHTGLARRGAHCGGPDAL